MTGYRELSHNRDFTILWAGETVSELGSRMSLFVFPLLAYQLSHSALVASIAETAYLLGMLLTMLPAGVLADRMHRGHLMRIASGNGVLLYASLAIAGALHHLTITHLVIVGLLAGAGAGTFAPAETSALRSVVPNDQLPTAMSQNQARQHIASLLGGPVGGALMGLVRWLPFAVDAISYAVSFVTLGRIRTDLSAPHHDGARPRVRDDLKEGFRFVWASRFLRTLTTWAAMVNLVINALFFVAVLRLLQAGFHPATIGLVDAAAGVAGIVGAVLAPRIIDTFATGRLTVMVAWSMVPLTVPMIFWNNPLVVALAIGCSLFLNPAGNAGIGAYRMALTPDRMQGRVASASQFAAMAIMPLAPLAGGALLSGLGGPAAMAGLATSAAACALVVTLSRTVRSVPRPAVWRAELESAPKSPLTSPAGVEVAS
ncbi:MFS transporter [Leekyejoonella antrihumi]|uniref:MFS transporter n=1 Tax=Leekyejoonella antrihumi TaxID=1660198 RepID=A0A563DYB5_9MICO|nr:MFS transporter [Leekyejoonella antrihumi]TWP34962.1 MFS transporter [Leekyejoonella antrihumi]